MLGNFLDNFKVKGKIFGQKLKMGGSYEEE